MYLLDKNPALLLIDVQQAFLQHDYWGGNRNNIEAEKVCGQLLLAWRNYGLPIFHIRHASKNTKSLLHKSNAGFQFNEYVLPKKGETVITKSVNSAFIGTSLNKKLIQSNIDTLVIAGITTNHCVSTTTRMAGNLGFTTYLISDASACFDRVGVNGEKYYAQHVHDMSLSDLHGEFATVLNTKTILDALEN